MTQEAVASMRRNSKVRDWAGGAAGGPKMSAQLRAVHTGHGWHAVVIYLQESHDSRSLEELELGRDDACHWLFPLIYSVLT